MNVIKMFGCEVTIDKDEIFMDMTNLGNIGNSHATKLRQKIFDYLTDEGILEEHEQNMERKI
jgi:hypothetical protein